MRKRYQVSAARLTPVLVVPPDSGLPRLEVVIRSGEEATGLDIVDWAKKVAELGAGEILLTSKDADGTRDGYDLEMQRAVAEAVTIPVTASGGAGRLEHLYQAVIDGKAAAVLAAVTRGAAAAPVMQARPVRLAARELGVIQPAELPARTPPVGPVASSRSAEPLGWQLPAARAANSAPSDSATTSAGPWSGIT